MKELILFNEPVKFVRKSHQMIQKSDKNPLSARTTLFLRLAPFLRGRHSGVSRTNNLAHVFTPDALPTDAVKTKLLIRAVTITALPLHHGTVVTAFFLQGVCRRKLEVCIPRDPTRFLATLDNIPEQNTVAVGNSGVIWTGVGGLTVSHSWRPFRTVYLCFTPSYRSRTARTDLCFCVVYFIAQHVHNSPQTKQLDEWQSKIRMAKQSVDALSLKDVQLGLENGQFTAKKPTSVKSDPGHSSQGC